MLDASPLASILLDGTGRIIHRNEAARQMAIAGNGFRIVPTDPSLRAEFSASSPPAPPPS
jgi:hypothetical protein